MHFIQQVIEAKLRIRRESELRTKNTTTDTSIAGKGRYNVLLFGRLIPVLSPGICLSELLSASLPTGESAPSREELKRSVESKPQPLPSEEEGPFIDPNTPIAQRMTVTFHFPPFCVCMMEMGKLIFGV